MIYINLLPHREAARAQRKTQFQAAMLAALLLGAVLAALAWGYYQAQIGLQTSRNEELTGEIAKLDNKIKEIATLRSEIQALQARQKSVEDLQADRNLPVHLLDELVKQMPDGTHVSSITQQGQVVTISGVAQSQERVSELLANMARRSEWFSKPTLIGITASNQPGPGKVQQRVSSFGITLSLVKPSDLQKAAEEAAAKAEKEAKVNAAASPPVPVVVE